MKNQYKRRDIFICSQEAHAEFEGRVSVFHVLKQKECYPQGCLYFLWHCALLAKNRRCVKGYTWAGRNCRGCTHFIEEKINLQPQLAVSDTRYADFLDDLEDFEIWLDTVMYKRLSCAGTIAAVKPRFERVIFHQEARLRLSGYLLIIGSGYIGTTFVEDVFYIRVSRSMMRTYRFSPGMKIDCTGEIRLDRGRIVIHQPKSVETTAAVQNSALTDDEALVAVKTAVLMRSQPEACLECPWGALADVLDKRENPPVRSRNLYCLKGVGEPAGCPVRVSQLLQGARLQPDGPGPPH